MLNFFHKLDESAPQQDLRQGKAQSWVGDRTLPQYIHDELRKVLKCLENAQEKPAHHDRLVSYVDNCTVLMGFAIKRAEVEPDFFLEYRLACDGANWFSILQENLVEQMSFYDLPGDIKPAINPKELASAILDFHQVMTLPQWRSHQRVQDIDDAPANEGPTFSYTVSSPSDNIALEDAMSAAAYDLKSDALIVTKGRQGGTVRIRLPCPSMDAMPSEKSDSSANPHHSTGGGHVSDQASKSLNRRPLNKLRVLLSDNELGDLSTSFPLYDSYVNGARTNIDTTRPDEFGVIDLRYRRGLLFQAPHVQGKEDITFDMVKSSLAAGTTLENASTTGTSG